MAVAVITAGSIPQAEAADPAAVAAAISAAIKMKGDVEGIVNHMFGEHQRVSWCLDADGSGFVVLPLKNDHGRLTCNFDASPFLNREKHRTVRFQVVGLSPGFPKEALHWHVKSDVQGGGDGDRQDSEDINPGDGDRIVVGQKERDDRAFYLAGRMRGMDEATFERMNPNAVVIIYLEKP